MKEIILKSGEKVIVDDEDYDFLIQWSWSFGAGGYAFRSERGRYIMMHRLINRTPNGKDTDHINRNKLDNRRSNLRTCSKAQNAMNREGCKNTSSKYKGVYWCNRRQKWSAEITSNYKRTNLGVFDNEEDAARAYNKMAVKIHDKDFVGLNQISD